MTQEAHTPVGYRVTSVGEVWSTGSNWRGYGERLMREHLDKDGYPYVRLTIAGSRKRFRVHFLVAQAFLGPRPSPQHEVRHLDGNKRHNTVTNLAWGTRKQNAADRAAHGKTSHGEKHSRAIKLGLLRASELRA